jgi:DNA-binding cell septation regulator SpoVG
MTTTSPHPATVEVLKLVACEKGSLKAFVSVRIGPSLTVHKCRVIQQPGQRAWVSMPQEQYQGHDGQTRYAALIELSGELKRRVEQAVLQEARRQGLITT